MNISTRLNRDFYVKMRINGYSHDTITQNIFPPNRFEPFCNDVRGLENIDYTKKVDIQKLVEGIDEIKTKNKIKK